MHCSSLRVRTVGPCVCAPRLLGHVHCGSFLHVCNAALCTRAPWLLAHVSVLCTCAPWLLACLRHSSLHACTVILCISAPPHGGKWGMKWGGSDLLVSRWGGGGGCDPLSWGGMLGIPGPGCWGWYWGRGAIVHGHPGVGVAPWGMRGEMGSNYSPQHAAWGGGLGALRAGCSSACWEL